TFRQWSPRSAAVGLLVFGLGAWALFFGVSLVGHSLYVLRVLLPVIGALLLVGGIALAAAEHAGGRALAAALLGSLLLSGVLSLHLYYRYTRKQEIRQAVETILRRSHDGDAAALVQHRYRWAVAYYLRGHDYPLIPVDLYLFSAPG